MKYPGVYTPLSLGFQELDPAILEETTRLRSLLYRIRLSGRENAPHCLRDYPPNIIQGFAGVMVFQQCIPFDGILSSVYRQILSLNSLSK